MCTFAPATAHLQRCERLQPTPRNDFTRDNFTSFSLSPSTITFTPRQLIMHERIISQQSYPKRTSVVPVACVTRCHRRHRTTSPAPPSTSNRVNRVCQNTTGTTPAGPISRVNWTDCFASESQDDDGDSGAGMRESETCEVKTRRNQRENNFIVRRLSLLPSHPLGGKVAVENNTI